MKHLTLQKKLWLCCGSLLAILLLVAGIGYTSARKTATLVQTVQFNVHKQQLASAIQLAIEKEKVGGREVLLGHPIGYLDLAHAEFDSKMAELQPLLSSPTSHQLFDKIQQVNKTYLGVTDETIQLYKSGDSAKALDLYFGPRGQQCRTDLKAATTELVEWYSKLAADAEAEELASAQRASLLILGFSILGLLAGVGIAVLMIRSLIESVGPMVQPQPGQAGRADLP